MYERKYHKGHEKFVLSENEQAFSVSDFWAFAFGDLLDNTRRGALAEFIVAKALGLDTQKPRRDWSEFDLDYQGVRVEVKTSAYIQSWNLNNEKISEPRFSISPAYVFDDDSAKYVGEQERHSDAYVFCLYAETDKSAYNILDLSKWEFYIVATRRIEEAFGTQKSVTLKALKRKCGAEKVGYETVKGTLDSMFIK